MGAKTLIEEKKAEVSNLASRYGVDRYIGTREFEMVDALVAVSYTHLRAHETV